MSKLEDLQPNASLRGVLPDVLVTVVSVQWFGSDALALTYKDPGGKLGSELLYRHDEPRLEVAQQWRPWRASMATATCSGLPRRRAVSASPTPSRRWTKSTGTKAAELVGLPRHQTVTNWVARYEEQN